MGEVTIILERIEQGDPQAAEELLPLLYDELRRLAAKRISGESPGHTLQATALVHEAYMRLVGGGSKKASWESRGHFFAAASLAMRRILVESARRKQTEKHGCEYRRLSVDPERLPESSSPEYVLAIDESLKKLAEENALAAELVQLRYFGGLTLKEAAASLGIPRRTADRYWAFAKGWLYLELTSNES